MNWEQKLAALGALCGGVAGVYLFMRSPGDWGVLVKGVERKEGGCLSGGGLSGKSPEEAVEAAWRWATEGSSIDKYLVVDAYRPNRKAYVWNGFMWRQIEEPSQGGAA